MCETFARIRGRWHYIYRVIDGQIVDDYVSPTRDMVVARTFFEPATASTGRTPRRVITDEAATYPPALAVVMPGVLHRTGRCRTNGVERDQGFPQERFRPMRGLKSVASAAIFTRGHALMRNIRRRFYRVIETVPAAVGVGFDLGPAGRSRVIHQCNSSVDPWTERSSPPPRPLSFC